MSYTNSCRLNKKHLSLAIMSALIVGCSDSGSATSQPSNPQPATYTIKAIDGYLQNAHVYGGENCTELLGLTDSNGELSIEDKYRSSVLCVEAVAGITFDTGRQSLVEDTFSLKAPASSDVVTPMTDLVVEQMEQDETLTLEEAQQNVVVAVSPDPDTPVSEEILFGDYTQEDSVEADAVELLAETLVDTETKSSKDLTIEEKLQITESVSDNIVSEIEDKGELPEHYAPVVDDDGGVTSNYKPVQNPDYPSFPTVQEYEVLPGTPATLDTVYVGDWFIDENNDTLIYSVDAELNGKRVGKTPLTGETPTENTIYLNESNEIVGALVEAGTYTIYVYASDSKTKSLPVTYQAIATTPNRAPVLVEDVQNQVQLTLTEQEMYANEAVQEAISIEGLFDDPDGDALTYEVDHQTNAKLKVENNELVFSGAFNGDDVGTQTITITAFDGLNEHVDASFSFTVLPAKVVNHPPQYSTDEYHVLQAQMNNWDLTEGEEVTYSLDVKNLFSDLDGDALLYMVESTLHYEKGTLNKTAFQSHISDDLMITFSGKLPRSGDDETLAVIASDSLEERMAPFTFPTIKPNDNEIIENTLQNFLIDSDLDEYLASMNSTLFNDDGGVEIFDASYHYNTDGIWLDGNKMCMDETCNTYDEFLYVGQENNLAIGYTATSHKDRLIWSHDDIRHDIFPSQIVPDALHSGTWYSIMDDSGSSTTPDMMVLMQDHDNSEWSEGGEETYPFNVVYNLDRTIEYTYTVDETESFNETCKVLSVEADLIAMSCEWLHDGNGPLKQGYRLMTQDVELMQKLVLAP